MTTYYRLKEQHRAEGVRRWDKEAVGPVKSKNPCIFSVGAAFLVSIIVSLLFPEKEALTS
jgi:Na+(H+)/acetate symporter ActP